MSNGSYTSSNHQVYLYRENSLPTYEEATGQIPKSVPALVVRQPNVIHNVNVREPCDDELIPIHQSHSQEFINTSSRRDMEAGLQQTGQHIPRHEDPVPQIRMAQTVLRERVIASRKRYNAEVNRCIGVVCIMMFVVVAIVILLFDSTRPSPI